MPRRGNHFTVDGIDFRKMFHFPGILRCLTSAMQPPRLVIALFMVVALQAVGGTWDSLSTPTVHPMGYHGPAIQDDAAFHKHQQSVLQEALMVYGTSMNDDQLVLDPIQVRRKVQSSYKYFRTDYLAEALNIDPTDELAQNPYQRSIESYDDEFLTLMDQIDSVTPQGAFAALSGDAIWVAQELAQGVIQLEPRRIVAATRHACIEVPIGMWRQERLFAILFGAFTLMIFAIGGGALCRMAACEIAGQERLQIREAVTYAIGNWQRLLLAPLYPLVLAGVLALLMLIPSVLLAIPWLNVIGAVLYAIAISMGILLSILLLGYALCAPLLVPAIACENCDAADAQLRAYAYVLHRPVHLFGYALLSLVTFGIGFWIVSLVASTTINTTAGLASTWTDASALVGSGGASMFDLTPAAAGAVQENWHQSLTATLINFWQAIIVDLVAAYTVSFIFAASTMVYLLMRKASDGQDLEEIWRPGLAPGTLVPLPNARIIAAGKDEEESSPESDSTPADSTTEPKIDSENSSDHSQTTSAEESGRLSERMITGALRTAVSTQQPETSRSSQDESA